MLAEFRALFLPAAAALLLATPALGDDVVKQAQTMLNALGYKVGTPDGAAGKKTLAAMDKVSAKYGQTFDGTVSENEIAFLAGIVPQKLTVDLQVAVSEISYVDSADVNGDGRLDFVVTGMADPAEQLGIECCEVPADRVKDIVAPVPILVYSTPAGFAAMGFPPEAKGNRTWAGRFFTTPQGQYFVLGKNGEMGLPGQNYGEKSMVFRLGSEAGEMTITTVAEFPNPGVTGSIEVWDLDGNGQPEILEDNYGKIGNRDGDGSVVMEFASDETLHPSKLTAELEGGIAHNTLRFFDIDGSGKADLLGATEVWKSFDGKQMQSPRAGSYIMLDPFTRETSYKDWIFLDPPPHGDDQAGFSLLATKAGGRTFIFEHSMRFLGHQAGGYDKYTLDVSEFLPDHTLVNRTKELMPKTPKERDNSVQAYLTPADFNFDGTNEVYVLQYIDKPQYLQWTGDHFALKDFPSKDFFKPDWAAKLAYLPDPALKCTRMVTFTNSLGGGKTKLDLRISACVPAVDMK